MRNMEKSSKSRSYAVALVCVNLVCLGLTVSSFAQGTQSWAEQRKIVTLDVKAMNVTEVLKIISDTSGWSIICSPNVKGKVTVWIKDITVQELLDKLLAVNGFMYTKEGNTLTVMTEDESAKMFGKEREVFPVKFADVTKVAEMLKALSSKHGKIIADPRTSKVVVIDTKDVLVRMEELIAGFDERAVTRSFKLQFADPEQVKTKLQTMVSKQGKIEADKRTGQVIVTDILANIQLMEGIVKGLDQEPTTAVLTLQYVRAEEVKAAVEKFYPT